MQYKKFVLLIILMKFICSYSNSLNHLLGCNNLKNKIFINNDSLYFEFKKNQYDTIEDLQLVINDTNTNIDLNFDNFNHIKFLRISCYNFEIFDNISPKLFNNIDFIDLRIKNIGEIPISFIKFSKLKGLRISADTSTLKKIDLENIFKIKSLLSFEFFNYSFVNEIHCGKVSNNNYEYISIGNWHENKLNLISFDSLFF